MSQGRSRRVLLSVGDSQSKAGGGGGAMEGSRRVWTVLELGEEGEWRRCWSTRGPLPTLRTGASFSGSVAWTTFATTFASHPLVTRVSVLHARASLCVISYLGTRARQGTVL